jgi:iron complex outermembrane receptor protein
MRRPAVVAGWLALACWAAVPATAQQSGTVAGRVVDASSREPVPTAAVRVVGTVILTFSDDSGRFELRGVPAGLRRLSVERISYAPRRVEVDVPAGGRTEIEIELEPQAVAVGELVTSVTMRELSSLNAPVSVSVLKEEQIRERVPATAADAVAYVPSVQFVGDQMNIRASAGYSRGAGSRVLMLVDGVPANAGDSDAINWDVIPLTEVTRIEVMKGAGSALYGTIALGGVVNVVTAPPPQDPTARLRLRGGFYDDPPSSAWIWSNKTRGYASAELSYGQSLGAFGFWLRGGRWIDDGYRQNDELERTNVAFQLTLAGAADTLGLFASVAREDYGAPLLWCMRGECEDPDSLAFQPARVAISALDDETRSDKGRIHLTHRRHWSDRASTFFRAYVQRNDWDTNFGDTQIGAVSDRLSGELRFDWRALNWLFLTLGGEGTYTEVEGENFFGSGFMPDRLATHDITALALYAQGELSIASWLVLIAGVRRDVAYLDEISLSDPWNEQWSPRVGAVLSPSAATRVRASIGRGFRAPSADELFTATQVGGFLVVPNPNLRAERSLAGELGIQQLVASWLSLDVAGFFYEFDDFIEADTVLSPLGILIQFENLPEASVAGIEANARLSLLRNRLHGFVAYTYIHHEDTMTGEPLAYRPNDLLTASANFDLGALELGADYRYASAFDRVKLFTDPRTDPLVPTRVLDVRLAYRFGRQVLRFIVNNAANYGYTTIERNLEPIRRYSVALDLEF